MNQLVELSNNQKNPEALRIESNKLQNSGSFYDLQSLGGEIQVGMGIQGKGYRKNEPMRKSGKSKSS